MKTTPDVFIVQSLRFDDEEGQHYRRIVYLAYPEVGRTSSAILLHSRLNEPGSKFLDRFEASAFRYLHISCHANRNGIALTLDNLDIDDLGALLSPYLESRRIFFSACKLVTPELARALLKETGCYSVIGPSNAIRFDEAALFWASLYHLMFRNDETVMKRQELQRNLRALSAVLGVNVRYFSVSQSAEGWVHGSPQFGVNQPVQHEPTNRTRCSYEDLPRRLFLDSSTLQRLESYGEYIYDGGSIEEYDRISSIPHGFDNIEALRQIMFVGTACPF